METKETRQPAATAKRRAAASQTKKKTAQTTQTKKAASQAAQTKKTAARTAQTKKSASQTAKQTAAGQTSQRTARQQNTSTRKTAARKSAVAAAKARQRTASKTEKKQVQRPTPDVVYTPPKPFSRNRLLLQLATVVAVVLALTFSISIFFKVDADKITVSGTRKYTAWDIREASGIKDGDNLLTLSDAKISGMITAALPYVDSVRVGIRLPDTVQIEITELDVAYSIRDEAGKWWLITSQGRVVEQVNSATAGSYTQIKGVTLADPQSGEQAVAAEQDLTDADGETVFSAFRGSDRLSAVLSITQYLEENGVIGSAASVDVTDMGNIELWYGQRFQVLLGDTTQLSYKIASMKAAVDQLAEYERGTLDVSFTVMNDPMYTSFD